MGWEPQLAPPIDRPPIKEYAVRYPWGMGLVAASIIAIFLAMGQMMPPSCADAVYQGTCFARRLMENDPILAVLSFPLLHGNSVHLISNLVPIVILGILFEQKHSSLTFIGLVVLAGYLSVYADIVMGVAVGDLAIAIGASGATRALAGFVLIQYASVNVFDPVKLESVSNRWTAPVIDVGRLAGLILAVTLLLTSVLEYLGIIGALPEIALFAHLVGAVTGVLTGLYSRLT